MQQPPDNHDNANGAGLGVVDIYDANGKFVKTLIAAGGAVKAPWGVTLAPADFGTLSNTLLIGNFGDGKINGYDPNSGQFMGTLSSAASAATVAPVFASNATATFPPAKRSAMIPEPTTVAARRTEPTPSAVRRRIRLMRLLPTTASYRSRRDAPAA